MLYGHPAKDNTKYKGETSRLCVNYEVVPSTNKKHIHYIHCRWKFRNLKEKHTGMHVSNLLRPLLLHSLTHVLSIGKHTTQLLTVTIG